MKKAFTILGLSFAIAIGGTALSATPAAPVQKAEAAVSIGSCYWGIDGSYWCYRTGCSYMDWRLYGCYNGWFRVNRPWYA